MSIWHQAPTVESLNAMSKDTLVEHVDIRFTEVGDDYIAGTMPVDNRTTQPFGLLHGGATVVLAETLGSSAANCCLDMSTHYAVGLEINTNHLRSVRSGRVKATARPIHIGRSTQVWEIRTEDESGRLTAISRLTMAVVPRQER
ncbi:hotdog fold thioesterase [Thioalkalivibrio sp. XN279]|uniref:hotdog fold thioesterase n=1 Tax=Thioalkalivibrio sp. XN279 TaxID=2714953 RepID=UPI00351B120B